MTYTVLPSKFKISSAYLAKTSDGIIGGVQNMVTEEILSDVEAKTSVDTGFFTPGVYRVNPYVVTKSSFNPKSCSLEWKWTEGLYNCSYKEDGYLGARGLGMVYADPTGSVVNLRAQAIQKAYAKLGRNDVGLGENLGELRETLNLLRHPFKDLGDFLSGDKYHNLKRLNQLFEYRRTRRWVNVLKSGTVIRLRGVTAARAAASAWLELRYGVMPLMYTVFDVVKLCEKQAEIIDSSKIRSCLAKVSSTTQSATKLKYWWYMNAVYSATGHFSDSYTAYASVQYRKTGSLSLPSQLGLSPRFWPELYWELTRLSFVVDWWFSVGSFLGSIRGLATPEITILGNTVGVKVTRHVTLKGSCNYSNAFGSNVRMLPDCGSADYEGYTRTCNEHLPISPLVKLEFKSYLHTVDALALTLQACLRNIRR